METRIAGIPCRVEMTGGTYTKPNRGADNPWDFYGGWDDIEFEVYDRRGRAAPWLAKKLTDKDIERITEELIEEAQNAQY